MHHLLVSLIATLTPSCYLPPVDAPITRPFIAPMCAYCPGHRGVEYDLRFGTPVRAVAEGKVSFSGIVAGTRYVVVQQVDGRRATYGDLSESLMVGGRDVSAGDVIGRSGSSLYFGLRDSDTPVDPTPLLGHLRRTIRLVPSSGRAARAGRPPTVECASSPDRAARVAGTSVSAR